MSFKKTLFNLKRTLSLLLSMVILTPMITTLLPSIQILASTDSSFESFQNVGVDSSMLGGSSKEDNYLKFIHNKLSVNNTNLSDLYIEGAELFRVSLIKANNNPDTTTRGKLVTAEDVELSNFNNPSHVAPLGFINYWENTFHLSEDSELYTPQNYYTLRDNNSTRHPSNFNTRRDYIAPDEKVLRYNCVVQTTHKGDVKDTITDSTIVYQGGGFSCESLHSGDVYELPLLKNIVSNNTPCLNIAEETNELYNKAIGISISDLSNTDYFKAISQAIYVDPEEVLNPEGESAQVMLYHLLCSMTDKVENIYNDEDIKNLVKSIQSHEYEILIEPMLIFKCDDNKDDKSSNITNVMENIFSNYPYVALTCGDMGFIDDAYSTVMYGFTSPDTYYYLGKGNSTGDGRGYNPMIHNPKSRDLMARFHKSLMLTESHPQVGLYSIYDKVGQEYFSNIYDKLSANKASNVTKGLMLQQEKSKPGAFVQSFFYKQIENAYNNSNKTDGKQPNLNNYGDYQVPDIFAFINTGGLYILPVAYDTIDYTPTLVGKSNSVDTATGKPVPSSVLDVDGQKIPIYKESYDKTSNTISFKASSALNKDNTVWTASVLSEKTRNGTETRKLNGVNLPLESDVIDITNAKSIDDGNYYIPANTNSRVTVTYTDDKGKPIEFKQVNSNDGSNTVAGSSIISNYTDDSSNVHYQALFITNSNMYGFDKDDNPISDIMSVAQAKDIGDSNISLGDVIHDEVDNSDSDNPTSTGYIQMKLPSPEHIPENAKYVRVRYEVNTGGLINSIHNDDGSANHERNVSRPVQYTDIKNNTLVNAYALYNEKDTSGNYKAISDCVEKGDFLKDNTVDILIPITQSAQLDFATKIVESDYISVGTFTEGANTDDEKDYEVGLICTKATFSCEDETDIPDEGIDIPFSISNRLIVAQNPTTYFSTETKTPNIRINTSVGGATIDTSKSVPATDTNMNNASSADSIFYNVSTASKGDSNKILLYPSLKFYKKDSVNKPTKSYVLNNESTQAKFSSDSVDSLTGSGTMRLSDSYTFEGKSLKELVAAAANSCSSSFHSSATNISGNYFGDENYRLYLGYDATHNQYAAMLISLVIFEDTYDEKYVDSRSGINGFTPYYITNSSPEEFNREYNYTATSYEDNVDGSRTVKVNSGEMIHSMLNSKIQMQDREIVYTKSLNDNKIETKVSKISNYDKEGFDYLKAWCREGSSDVKNVSFSNNFEYVEYGGQNVGKVLKYLIKDTSTEQNNAKYQFGSIKDLPMMANDTSIFSATLDSGSKDVLVQDQIPSTCINNISMSFKGVDSSNDWYAEVTVDDNLKTPILETDENGNDKLPSAGSVVNGSNVVFTVSNDVLYYLYPLSSFKIEGKGQLFSPDNVLDSENHISHSMQLYDMENKKTIYNAYGYGSKDGDIKYPKNEKVTTTANVINTEAEVKQDNIKVTQSSKVITSNMSTITNEDLHTQLANAYGEITTITQADNTIKMVSDFNGSPYIAVPQGQAIDIAAVYSVNYKITLSDANLKDVNYSIPESNEVLITEVPDLSTENVIYTKASQPGNEEDYENNFAISYFTLEGPNRPSVLNPNAEDLSCTLPESTGVSINPNAPVTYKTAIPRASFTTSSPLLVDYIWGKPPENISKSKYQGEVVYSYFTKRKCDPDNYADSNARSKKINELNNTYYVYKWIEYKDNDSGYQLYYRKVPAYKKFKTNVHHVGCNHALGKCTICTHYEYRQLSVPFKRSYTMIYDNDYINDPNNSRAGSVEGKNTDKDYVVTAGKGIIATVRSKLITDFGATGTLSNDEINKLNLSKATIINKDVSSSLNMEINPSFEFRYSIGGGKDKFDQSPYYSVLVENKGNNKFTTTSAISGNSSNDIKMANDKNLNLDGAVKIIVTKSNEVGNLNSYIITNIIGGNGLYTNHNYPESNNANNTGLTVQMITTLNGKNAITIGGKKQSLNKLTFACQEDGNFVNDKDNKDFSDNFILGQCWRYRLFVLSNMYNDVWARPTD